MNGLRRNNGIFKNPCTAAASQTTHNLLARSRREHCVGHLRVNALVRAFCKLHVDRNSGSLALLILPLHVPARAAKIRPPITNQF